MDEANVHKAIQTYKEQIQKHADIFGEMLTERFVEAIEDLEKTASVEIQTYFAGNENRADYSDEHAINIAVHTELQRLIDVKELGRERAIQALNGLRSVQEFQQGNEVNKGVREHSFELNEVPIPKIEGDPSKKWRK